MDELLRGLINLNYASPDLETTIAAAERCYEEARRIGDRNHATYVGGNLQGVYTYVLRLDEAKAVLDELFIATEAERTATTAARAGLLYWRGNEEEGRALLAEAESLLEGVSDTQTRLILEREKASMIMLDGDPRLSFETFKRHFEETPFAPGIALSGMADGAIFSQDPALIAEAIEALESQPKSPINDVILTRTRAARAILEGQVRDGVELLDHGITRAAEGGDKLFELFTAAVGAALLPDGADRSRFAGHARGLADAADGSGLARWIDRLEAS